MNVDVLKMLQFAIVAGGILMLVLWVLYFFWIRPTICRNRQNTRVRTDRRNGNLHDSDTTLSEASGPNVQSSYQLAGTRQARLAAAMLGLETQSDLQWALAIRQGFPVKAIDLLIRQSGLTNVELAQILGVPHGALDRQEQGKALSQMESEHLLRLASTLALAADTFDDMTVAMSWMRSPHPEISNLSPLSLLDTAPGAQFVRRMLASMAYGIPG